MFENSSPTYITNPKSIPENSHFKGKGGVWEPRKWGIMEGRWGFGVTLALIMATVVLFCLSMRVSEDQYAFLGYVYFLLLSCLAISGFICVFFGVSGRTL